MAMEVIPGTTIHYVQLSMHQNIDTENTVFLWFGIIYHFLSILWQFDTDCPFWEKDGYEKKPSGNYI